TYGVSLDDLFGQVQRPHYMARGGRVGMARGGMVTGDTDYGPAMARALNALARASGQSIFVQSGGRTVAEQLALKAKYGNSRPVASSGAGGDGAAPTGAGALSFGQLRSLWVRAGGDPGLASLMAHVAVAESGGNPNAYNASGATGLWQILGALVPGNLRDPLV